MYLPFYSTAFNGGKAIFIGVLSNYIKNFLRHVCFLTISFSLALARFFQKHDANLQINFLDGAVAVPGFGQAPVADHKGTDGAKCDPFPLKVPAGCRAEDREAPGLRSPPPGRGFQGSQTWFRSRFIQLNICFRFESKWGQVRGGGMRREVECGVSATCQESKSQFQGLRK